jgi:hypothetical protein
MNQLFVTLTIILFPGILATVICDKITVHSTKWDSFKYGLYSFVFGVMCYSILQVLFFIVSIKNSVPPHYVEWRYLEVWSNAVSEKPNIPVREVFWAVCLSFPVALIGAYIVNHKVLIKIANKINITSIYGDENLYSYYLNAEEVDWVYVRDIGNNLTYQGRINSFSENDHIQELVLVNVTVYRYSDSAYLYEIPTVYLSKSSGNFIIETIPDNLLK